MWLWELLMGCCCPSRVMYPQQEVEVHQPPPVTIPPQEEDVPDPIVDQIYDRTVLWVRSQQRISGHPPIGPLTFAGLTSGLTVVDCDPE